MDFNLLLIGPKALEKSYSVIVLTLENCFFAQAQIREKASGYSPNVIGMIHVEQTRVEQQICEYIPKIAI